MSPSNLADNIPITQRSPISGLEPTDYIRPDVRVKWRRAQWNGIMIALSLVSMVGVYVWNF